MPYKLNEKQMQAVSRLPGPQRYEHFIKRVADGQEVWGLKSDAGWVGVADDQGRQCIPFWPHPDYARAFATKDWATCTPQAIPLADFLHRWLPNMASENTHAAIFSVPPSTQGIVVEPLRLKQDLETERQQYE